MLLLLLHVTFTFAYLKPSWAILGASWDQERFRNPRPAMPVPLRKDLDQFWGSFWGPKLAQNSLFWGSFFGPFFEHFLDHFWGHFGGHFGTRSAQEEGKTSPRGPSRASKTRKATFSKTLKNLQFFKVFGVQRPPKRASRGPRRLPRGTQRAPKPNKKEIQKWIPKLSIFCPILGPFWGPFRGQN